MRARPHMVSCAALLLRAVGERALTRVTECIRRAFLGELTHLGEIVDAMFRFGRGMESALARLAFAGEAEGV
jgi:hypothetical protein